MKDIPFTTSLTQAGSAKTSRMYSGGRLCSMLAFGRRTPLCALRRPVRDRSRAVLALLSRVFSRLEYRVSKRIYRALEACRRASGVLGGVVRNEGCAGPRAEICGCGAAFQWPQSPKAARDSGPRAVKWRHLTLVRSSPLSPPRAATGNEREPQSHLWHMHISFRLPASLARLESQLPAHHL